MKKIKLSKTLMILTFLYYIIYNSYFGWNIDPINDNELKCDYIFKFCLNMSIVLYFMPLLDVYESIIKKYEQK